jgi:hypothetical protein
MYTTGPASPTPLQHDPHSVTLSTASWFGQGLGAKGSGAKGWLGWLIFSNWGMKIQDNLPFQPHQRAFATAPGRLGQWLTWLVCCPLLLLIPKPLISTDPDFELTHWGTLGPDICPLTRKGHASPPPEPTNQGVGPPFAYHSNAS